MARYAAQGAQVYYLILTDGGNGTTDRAQTREKLMRTRHKEQRRACETLGVEDVFFCTYPDGCLENTRDVRRDIVRVVRQVKPDVVITWDPSMLYCAERNFINHPDHRASGQAALDAVFPLARDHMSFPELLEEGHEPHKTATVLLINFNQSNFCVDVTDYLDAKMQAIAAHASQVPDMAYVRELFTDLARQAGDEYGVPYAETFMRIDTEL